MKNSANIIETTFCNSKDTPKEYLDDAPIMIYRNGEYKPLIEHNKKANKRYRPKKNS